MNLYNDDFIRFEAEKHQYFGADGNEYQSVSRVLKTIQNPFDRMGISNAMSKRDGITQQEILDQWDKKRIVASDYGTLIHNGLEDYFNGRKVKDKIIENLAKEFSKELSGYYKISNEHILHDKEYKIAGTTDLLLDRQKHTSASKEWIVDLMDYKTNLEKGIYFDSITRKNGNVKHYNKFLLPPLTHLEECNYNLYALQLSSYALMLEKTYGIKIGKLFIVWIRYNDLTQLLDYTMIPVPYMKFEVQALFKSYSELKKVA